MHNEGDMIIETAHVERAQDATQDTSQDALRESNVMSGTDTIIDEELAVAIALDRDDLDPSFLPSAVAHDLHSKEAPARRNNRVYRFLSVFLLVLVFASVVAIIVTLTRKDDVSLRDGGNPRETLGIRQKVREYFDESDLQHPRSPYAKALDWIIRKDPMEPHPTDPTFIQRYILVYLYFSTTVRGPWKSCNPPDEEAGEGDFCAFKQVQAVQALPQEKVEPATRWLTNTHECSWAGVFCDEDQFILGLHLGGSQLSGTFPEGILHLSSLFSLILSFGELTGTLPVELSDLSRLVNLGLNHNEFTGEIPMEWGRASTLQGINVASNNIEGTVPGELGMLEDLEYLYLYENMLEGEIPPQLGEPDLIVARFHGNRLHGPLPSFMMNPALKDLWLQRNLFSGSIPAEVGRLSDANEIRFDSNRLSGTLPDEFFVLTARMLRINYNNITGELSTLIGQLRKVQQLDISDNNFYGQIPDEVGGLVGIDEIWFSGNKFTGTMPKSMCDLRGPDIFVILEADCLETEVAGVTMEPEVLCQAGCCTSCCDRKGFCRETGAE